MNYQRLYQYAQEKPEDFWAQAASALSWYKPWDKVLDSERAPVYRWFSGGLFNTCYNALDRHVEQGRAEQKALIYDSPVTGQIQSFSYLELRDQTAQTAGMLRSLGVKKGDRVLIYMPMIPQAVISMLACARIGAVHSVVFGGFVARELATRIDDAKPKVILTASCGIEAGRVIPYMPMVEQALALAAHQPSRCIVLQRPEHVATLKSKRDLDWDEAYSNASAVECVPVRSTDPLYILYTSGTTGVPKGIVRDNGGHATALHWTMKHVYGVQPGEVYWSASDIGWIVGHSYIVYGPLLHGNTTVLFEGKPVGTPDPGAFWRVMQEHQVKTLFTAPTAIRAIKKEDAQGQYFQPYRDHSLRALFLAGERCDPPTQQWASDLLNVPVIDHWWQTETSWAIASNFLGVERLKIKLGSATKPSPGYQVEILDEQDRPLPRGQSGRIMIRLPLPPGCFTTLWQNEERFLDTYMRPSPGYYQTGDAGYFDEEGYLFIMSRIDDIINVSGHRLSTGAIEEVLAEHPCVAECAVIGIQDSLRGEVPLGLITLSDGVAASEPNIAAELIALVREKLGAVYCFRQVLVVKRLPKTRSGKILRGTVRKMADGQSYTVPSTIDDPMILSEIAQVLRDAGFGTVQQPDV